jgi:hypothetical protein
MRSFLFNGKVIMKRWMDVAKGQGVKSLVISVTQEYCRYSHRLQVPKHENCLYQFTACNSYYSDRKVATWCRAMELAVHIRQPKISIVDLVIELMQISKTLRKVILCEVESSDLNIEEPMGRPAI